MKKIEQLYRDAPVRNSPDSLDREILEQAKRQVAGQSVSNTGWSLSLSWMPMAASFVVVGVGIALVLRSGIISTGGTGTSIDGYPESLIEADEGARSDVLMSGSGGSSPVASTPEGLSREERKPVSSDDKVRLLRQAENTQLTARTANKKESVVRLADQSRQLSDSSQDKLASSIRERRADLSLSKQAKQSELTSAATDLALTARSSTAASQRIQPVPQTEGSGLPASGDTAKSRAVASSLLPLDTDETEATDAVEPAAPITDRSALAASELAEQSHFGTSRAEISQQPAADSLSRLRPSAERSSADADEALDAENPRAQIDAVSGRAPDAAESNSRRQIIILVESGALGWLSKQQAAEYTLQLATAGDDIYLAELGQTIAENSPGELQVAVLPVPPANAGDTGSFTLLAGVYGTFDEAQNALAQLPVHARKFGARVRNIGVLQQLVK